MSLFVGIDIGQKRDPTAVAVAERSWRESPAGGRESHFTVRHLDRLPLGTPYPEIVKLLGGLVSAVGRRGTGKPTVYVDATGVGQPVVDSLARTCSDGQVVGVYFTAGRWRKTTRGRVTLGKSHLVSRLQALLTCRRVHLPNTQEAAALASELRTYELRVSRNAAVRFGAFRTGTHDDLVTALALAVQTDDDPRREGVHVA